MNEFLMGMSKEDITPELGSLLYGYPRERRAQRVIDPLAVGAVALKQGDEIVLLFGVDICAVNLDICTYIREEISKATGVKTANIMYSCIHTHSGPVTRNSVGWGTADMDYINGTLIPKSIKAANDALSSMVPALMAVGKIHSDLGMNRRQIKDGEVILGQNPDLPYDPNMTVVTFKSLDGKNLGSIAHYAAHPTVAGSNLSITRDWPSQMIDKLAEVTGAPCMYINGAEGNLGPRLSNGRTTADESYLAEIGEWAARDALKALEAATDFKAPTLKIHAEWIKFPYTTLPPIEEVEAEIESLGDPKDHVATQITRYAQLCKMRDILNSDSKMPEALDVLHTVIALDDFAMVPFPFEAFCEIALEIRERSPYKETILLGLTGGSYGYLPTLEQIPYGGYEIMSFHAASIPAFIDDLGAHLVNESVRLLNKLYNL